jgi:hypothetical protein
MLGKLRLYYIGASKSPACRLYEYRVHIAGVDDAASVFISNVPLCFWEESTKTQIIHYILHLLYTILDAVAALSERVVFEVEYLEASMDILDELADLERSAVIA